jgi:hypothetical protein
MNELSNFLTVGKIAGSMWPFGIHKQWEMMKSTLWSCFPMAGLVYRAVMSPCTVNWRVMAILNICSDSAWFHLTEWPQCARNYDLLVEPQSTTFSLHLPGAGHFSLTDLSLASPLLTPLLEGQGAVKESAQYLQEVNQACLAFFNRYLKFQ